MPHYRKYAHRKETVSLLKKPRKPRLTAKKKRQLAVRRAIRKLKKRALPIGVVLVVIGTALLSFPWIYKTVNNLHLGRSLQQNLVAAETKTATTSADIGPIQIDPQLLSQKEPSQPPSRVIIPSLDIDLPIIEANVVNGFWELSETTASHGVGSANPGENGNIVVFAHARKGLFLPLRTVKENDVIYIMTKDRWYRYKVSTIKEVAPDETTVISSTSDETLTLYTCTGFLDSKRLIVSAKPERI